MNLFLDSNALVKLYHKESGTENLLQLIDENAPDLLLTISDISKIEFHSAFLKRVRKREVTVKIVKEVFDSFKNDILMFNIVEVDNTVKTLASDLLKNIASKKRLGTLDSLQLSSAIISHQILPVDRFITSDRTLLNIANDYFSTFNPEQ